MDALAGLYDPDAERADVVRTLERMRRVLEPPALSSRAEIASAAGAGCVVLRHAAGNGAPSVAYDDSRDLWLIFAGELYARDELEARLDGRPHGAESDAQVCLRLYLSEGAGFVRHVNGHFNIIVYRPSERRLSIATDPFGYRPLFLATRGRRVWFASEMKAILAVFDASPAVDGIGLLELARHGWPLGDRTWLEPIRVAAAGCWYDLTPRGMQREHYFRFRFHRRTPASSLRDYVDAFATRLRHAMHRATRDAGRVGIPLSGGLDSRALLLAADGTTPPQLAYTFGQGDSPDVRFAVDLARTAGVAHLHLTYPHGYLGNQLESNVWRTEGLLPFSEATFTSMAFHDILAKSADVLVYGHAGDALTGAHVPFGVWMLRSKEQLIQRVFRQYNRVPEATLRRVFNTDFYDRFAPDLYESLRATFADIDQEDLADVLGVWDMENRQRRGTFASTAIDRCRFGVRAPFLDRELVEHLRTAPPLWRLQQLAYKQMIVSAFPHAAAVPWSHTGSRLQTNRLADFATLAYSYMHRRLGRVSGWPGAPHAFRNLAADTRADPRLAHVIREFAARSSFPAEVFNRRGIEEVVRRHWEGGEDFTHLVSMLATFATAYKLLLGEGPHALPTQALPPA